jgi:DNA/RNA-binding domain of Phe-tRNA-synthetase-like protein
MLNMHLRIDPEIFAQHPDLKIGAIILRGINNHKRVSSVESLLRGICAQRKNEFKDKEIYDDQMVHAWSQAYGRFGINPKKHAPSVAALLKRVKAGKEIPHINLLVDLYNYFSLKYLLPIGGEDLDWLYGDLNLTFTKGGEPFRALGSIDIDFAKEGEVAYKDSAGITCRYWNHRECERTKFRDKSNNVLILIEDMSKMHMDSFGAVLKDIQNNLIKYIGGQIEPYILNEENREIDLRVEGRSHADDSRVPQQERAHFLIEKQKKAAEAEIEK